MPKGVRWIKDSVVALDPDSRTVTLESGDRLTYDHVIVCPGIQKDFDRIPGLPAAMASPAGASHYVFELVGKASGLLRDLRRGTVSSCSLRDRPPAPGPRRSRCTSPATTGARPACSRTSASFWWFPIRRCSAFPRSIGSSSARSPSTGSSFGRETEVLEVDAEAQAVVLGRLGGGRAERLPYDVLHVVPPQSAPDWLKRSSLPAPDDPLGFVEVDTRTLRHARYPDVWSLGDAAATTNSKSGGALRKQTLALAKNLAAVLRGERPTTFYDGYAVCPFTVSRSTVVFAEFDDHYRLQPTIPFWRTLYRERRLAWVFDRHILPWAYWHLILKGASRRDASVAQLPVVRGVGGPVLALGLRRVAVGGLHRRVGRAIRILALRLTGLFGISVHATSVLSLR